MNTSSSTIVNNPHIKNSHQSNGYAGNLPSSKYSHMQDSSGSGFQKIRSNHANYGTEYRYRKNIANKDYSYNKNLASSKQESSFYYKK
jgi:hypothetical protein